MRPILHANVSVSLLWKKKKTVFHLFEKHISFSFVLKKHIKFSFVWKNTSVIHSVSQVRVQDLILNHHEVGLASVQIG
jgi:hypothetical protein